MRGLTEIKLNKRFCLIILVNICVVTPSYVYWMINFIIVVWQITLMCTESIICKVLIQRQVPMFAYTELCWNHSSYSNFLKMSNIWKNLVYTYQYSFIWIYFGIFLWLIWKFYVWNHNYLKFKFYKISSIQIIQFLFHINCILAGKNKLLNLSKSLHFILFTVNWLIDKYFKKLNAYI